MSRESKKHKKELEEKEARHLLRRWNQLSKERPIEVKTSSQFWGYKHTYEVRPDLLRSSEGPMLKSILPLVNREWFTRGKNSTPKTKFGNGFFFEFRFDQGLREIGEKTFNSLTEQQKKCFIAPFSFEKRKMYQVKYPWKFVVKTSRYYVDTVRYYQNNTDEERKLIARKLFDANMSLILDHRKVRDEAWDRLITYNRNREKRKKEQELRESLGDRPEVGP